MVDETNDANWDVRERPGGRNPLAWVGLVIGIMAVAYGLIPLLFFLAWLLAPFAILFGVIGLVIAARRPDRPQRGIAIAGTVLGFVAILAGIGGIIVIDRVASAISDRLEELIDEDEPVDDVTTTVTSCERTDDATVSAAGTVRSTGGDRPRVLTIEVEVRHGDSVAGVFTTLAVGVTQDSDVDWSGEGVGIELPGELTCRVRVFEPDPDAYDPDGFNVDDGDVEDIQDQLGGAVEDLIGGGDDEDSTTTTTAPSGEVGADGTSSTDNAGGAPSGANMSGTGDRRAPR